MIDGKALGILGGLSLTGFVFAAALIPAAPPARADSIQTCVDVRIGGDRSSYLNCLNNAMAAQVEHEQAKPAPTIPYDVHSEPNQIGGFNQMAAQEHMGDSFGVSSIPQRPHPVFASPLPTR